MTHEELIEMHAMVHDADQRSKSNTHRLDKMEERQDNLDKLVASVAVMAEKQENMGKAVEEIKTTVKTMASSSTVNTLKEDVESLKSKCQTLGCCCGQGYHAACGRNYRLYAGKTGTWLKGEIYG